MNYKHSEVETLRVGQVGKNQDFLFKSDFFIFLNSYFFATVFPKFLKLVCLLNHINNMAAMLLLFPVILLLSKK